MLEKEFFLLCDFLSVEAEAVSVLENLTTLNDDIETEAQEFEFVDGVELEFV